MLCHGVDNYGYRSLPIVYSYYVRTNPLVESEHLTNHYSSSFLNFEFCICVCYCISWKKAMFLLTCHIVMATLNLTQSALSTTSFLWTTLQFILMLGLMKCIKYHYCKILWYRLIYLLLVCLSINGHIHHNELTPNLP